jgi:glycerophosphoryl diester phosphodiesterase
MPEEAPFEYKTIAMAWNHLTKIDANGIADRYMISLFDDELMWKDIKHHRQCITQYTWLKSMTEAENKKSA